MVQAPWSFPYLIDNVVPAPELWQFSVLTFGDEPLEKCPEKRQQELCRKLAWLALGLENRLRLPLLSK